MTAGQPIVPVRAMRVTVTVPRDLWVRLTLSLFSPLEGRVPYGRYAEWLANAIREYFERETFDLAPYLSTLPEVHCIRAKPETVRALRAFLERTPDEIKRKEQR